MDSDPINLLIIVPIAAVVSVLQLMIGAYAGWHVRGRQVVPPAPSKDDLNPENVHELLDHLQFMAGSTADNIVQHSARLQEVKTRLTIAAGSDTAQHETINEAATLLLDANEELQAALKTAQLQLEAYAHQIEENMIEARTDALTSIANRRAFDEELVRRHATWQRRGTPCSLLFIDVDYFKKFNDEHGHPAGDEVLREVGRTLASTAREMDFVARYGGEEFAIILPDTPLIDARCAAERIRTAIAGVKLNLNGKVLRVTASVGLAELMPGDCTESLIQHADQALYAAKNNGRNRAYYFDGEEYLFIDPSVVQQRSEAAKAVQQELTQRGASRAADRRKHQRRPYSFTQIIAPYRRGKFPTPDMFREVQCQDLSPGGCSFLLPEAPDCDSYIVALGVEPHCTYLTAEVLHARRDSSKLPPVFAVGCRFTGRIEREAMPRGNAAVPFTAADMAATIEARLAT